MARTVYVQITGAAAWRAYNRQTGGGPYALPFAFAMPIDVSYGLYVLRADNPIHTAGAGVDAQPGLSRLVYSFSTGVAHDVGVTATLDTGSGPVSMADGVDYTVSIYTPAVMVIACPDGSVTFTVPAAVPLPVLTASGGVSARAAIVSGTGDVGIAGSGGVMAPMARVAGSVAMVVGAAAIQAPRATVAGTGDVPVTASGGVTAPTQRVAGTGTFALGMGTLSAPLPVVAGTGVLGALPPGYVSISPETVTLAPGATQQFTASISGVPNLDIIWSCSRGAISQTGLFEAPDVGDPVIVTATSAYDPTQSASATVTVVLPPGVTRRLVVRRWGYRA